MKANFLARIAYSGTFFRSSHNIDGVNKPKELAFKYVEDYLKRNVERYFGNDTTQVTIGIQTEYGTSSRRNGATFKVESNRLELFKNVERDKFINSFNFKLSDSNIPLRLHKLEDVPEDFCAAKNAQTCSYLFRFCDLPANRLNLLQYQNTSSFNFDKRNKSDLEEEINILNKSIKSWSPSLKLHLNLIQARPNDFLGGSFEDYPCHVLEISHLPANLSIKIKELLNLVLAYVLDKSESAADDLKSIFTPNWKHESSLSPTERISNLNGLYLNDVNYLLPPSKTTA